MKLADRTLCRENCTFSFKEKLEICRQLERLRVDVIELPAIENPKTDVLFVRTVSSFIADSILSVSVGMTEEECQAKGRAYEAKSLPMAYSGRFVAENEGSEGLCKIIIDKKKRNILGVHIIGAYAGEMIWGAAQMIEMQLRVTDARQIIFPHPTVSEIIRETLWEFPD